MSIYIQKIIITNETHQIPNAKPTAPSPRHSNPNLKNPDIKILELVHLHPRDNPATIVPYHPFRLHSFYDCQADLGVEYQGCV